MQIYSSKRSSSAFERRDSGKKTSNDKRSSGAGKSSLNIERTSSGSRNNVNRPPGLSSKPRSSAKLR